MSYGIGEGLRGHRGHHPVRWPPSGPSDSTVAGNSLIRTNCSSGNGRLHAVVKIAGRADVESEATEGPCYRKPMRRRSRGKRPENGRPA